MSIKYNGSYHTSEEMEKNFKHFHNKIIKICDKYNAKVEESRDLYEVEGEKYPKVSKSFDICVDENETITVWLNNDDVDNGKKIGKEGLYIEYEIYNNDKKYDFNLDFVIELINEMSCVSITKSVLEKLLHATESKFPNISVDTKKNKKVYNYDFWENTFIRYDAGMSMYEDDKYLETLSYSAYCKDI